MRNSKIIFFAFFLFISFLQSAHAETTFFDNPDDSFVMGSSTPPSTGEIIGGSSGITSATTAGNCLYRWNCAGWEECSSSGKQTRNCVNTGTCPEAYNPPEIEQNCDYTPAEPKEEEKKILEIIFEKIAKDNNILIYFIAGFAIFFIILLLKKVILKKVKDNFPVNN